MSAELNADKTKAVLGSFYVPKKKMNVEYSRRIFVK